MGVRTLYDESGLSCETVRVLVRYNIYIYICGANKAHIVGFLKCFVTVFKSIVISVNELYI